MKSSLAIICAALLASLCTAEESFSVDFSKSDSITIKNTGNEDITLSGRFWGDDKQFIPSLRTDKKVNEEWQSYQWDWCGTGRQTYTIKANESFTFPYMYHHAIGQVNVSLLGKQYGFINTEGHDLPTPKERALKKASAMKEEAVRIEKKLTEILKLTDVAERKQQLEELKKEMTHGYHSDAHSKVSSEIQFNDILLKNNITKQGTNRSRSEQ